MISFKYLFLLLSASTADAIDVAITDPVPVTANAFGDPSSLRGGTKANRPVMAAVANLPVAHLYTYGAPAVAKNPHLSNPGNTCIPGIRTYTDNYSSHWWGSGVAAADFASQLNGVAGYGHPKISTLILREHDWGNEYLWFECKDSDNQDYYEWEWYPGTGDPPSVDLHDIASRYAPRLEAVFDGSSVSRGETATAALTGSPLTEYTSIVYCSAQSTDEFEGCITHPSVLQWSTDPATNGWSLHQHMNHISTMDEDHVYTMHKDAKNAAGQDIKQCLIVFSGSKEVADFGSFLSSYTTGYCGRYGIHTGVRNELWQITNDPEWAANIKPSLAQCDELSCVGHSLGGALCNIFTMCANTDIANIGSWDKGMKKDYDSLMWDVKGSAAVDAPLYEA